LPSRKPWWITAIIVAIAGSILVGTAVHLPKFSEGCGTWLGLLTSLVAWRLGYNSEFSHDENVRKTLLLAGGINILLFLIGVVVLAWILRRKATRVYAIALAAWVLLYAGSLLYLFPASDCP